MEKFKKQPSLQAMAAFFLQELIFSLNCIEQSFKNLNPPKLKTNRQRVLNKSIILHYGRKDYSHDNSNIGFVLEKPLFINFAQFTILFFIGLFQQLHNLEERFSVLESICQQV